MTTSSFSAVKDDIKYMISIGGIDLWLAHVSSCMCKEKVQDIILEFFGFKLIVRICSTHPRLPFKTVIQVSVIHTLLPYKVNEWNDYCNANFPLHAPYVKSYN